MNETDFKNAMSYASWCANKYLLEVELEKLLATCGNMTGEIDRRDDCGLYRCPLFEYCVSLEPNPTSETNIKENKE